MININKNKTFYHILWGKTNGKTKTDTEANISRH